MLVIELIAVVMMIILMIVCAYDVGNTRGQKKVLREWNDWLEEYTKKVEKSDG